MATEQWGRWTAEGPLTPYGAPHNQFALAFALYALNEHSKGTQPGPTVARLTVSQPDGTPIGTFDVDAQDAEAISKTMNELSDARYGALERKDIDRMLLLWKNE